MQMELDRAHEYLLYLFLLLYYKLREEREKEKSDFRVQDIHKNPAPVKVLFLNFFLKQIIKLFPCLSLNPGFMPAFIQQDEPEILQNP